MKNLLPLLGVAGIAYLLFFHKKSPPAVITDPAPGGTGTNPYNDGSLLDPSSCGPGGCKIPTTNPNYAQNDATAVGNVVKWGH